MQGTMRTVSSHFKRSKMDAGPFQQNRMNRWAAYTWKVDMSAWCQWLSGHEVVRSFYVAVLGTTSSSNLQHKLIPVD